MNDEIKRHYDYILGIYEIAASEFTLGKKMLQDYHEQSHKEEIQIIVINALYHSLAVNLCKIVNSKEKLNIYKLIRNSGINTTFEIDDKIIERLISRRDKSLCHSDKINIQKDISEEYPLYTQDLKITLDSLSEILAMLSNPINGYSIAGRNIKTGEIEFDAVKRIERQYSAYKDMKNRYKLMTDFAKKTIFRNC